MISFLVDQQEEEHEEEQTERDEIAHQLRAGPIERPISSRAAKW